MVNRRINMRQIRQVLRLANESEMTQRAISRSLGISRETVRDYQMRAKALNLGWPLPEDLDDQALEARLFPSAALGLARRPAPDWAVIHNQLKIRGATLSVLHDEYSRDNPHALKISQFCNLYRDWRKTLKRYLRQVHVGGERVFVDYAGPTVPVYDETIDQFRPAQIFVGVMGGSCYTYAEAHWSQKLPNWVAAHVRMFDFFGAVPHIIICDNLKSGVTRASKTEPVVNFTYQHLAEHYGCAVVPARPRKPQDKSRAEGGVLLIERWILFRLRHRTFMSLEELNQAIFGLLEDLNNRPFQKLPGSRKSTFEAIDLPAMKALPKREFEYVEFRHTRVGMDGYIQVDGCPYTVPSALTRQLIELRMTTNIIELLFQGRRVGSLVRSYGTKPVVNPEHLPPQDRYFSTWTKEIELEWALTKGPNVHRFLADQLADCAIKEEGYRAAAALKKLDQEVGAIRLEAACALALQHGARGTKNLRSILKFGLEVQHPDAALQEASFDHPNIRGSDYYH